MDFLLPLFFILVIIGVIYLLTQSKIQIVPEEERLVVYRLGRFHHIAGPGPVVLQRSLDEVKRTFSVRDEPHNVRVNGLFMNGVPFGYTLNFWYRFDLKAAAGEDRERLVNLVQFSNEERERQVATKVREALVTSATKIEHSYKPAGTDFVHKLLPILPGLPESDALLKETRQHLSTTLRLVGAILNEAHPLTVTNIHLGDDIIKSFSRGRVATLLSESFPNLSPDMLLQAVSSIEGIDMPTQRVVFEGGGNTNAAMDFRVDEDGPSARVRVPPRGGMGNHQSPQESSVPTSQPPPVAAPLNNEDWQVLKQVPAA